jgi:hypothetical protein
MPSKGRRNHAGKRDQRLKGAAALLQAVEIDYIQAREALIVE